VSLDSAYAGNGTRYINHSARANCDTAGALPFCVDKAMATRFIVLHVVVLVNGEHRIGVYAGMQFSDRVRVGVY
jgi:hypothetical protein